MSLLVQVPSGHLLGMEDVAGQVEAILDDAIAMKQQARLGPLPQRLRGKAFVLIFEKNSTRTRVSFELGIQRLGGAVSTLDSQGSQMARGESLEDTALVLSRYADAVVYRANRHANVEAMARYGTVPVVNALTDLEHPCQVLADWMALKEHFGSLQGLTFAYVGDGNNMCHSYLLGAPLVGMDVQVATPAGYAPDPAIVAKARELAAAAGTQVVLTTDPQKAVRGADAVATDTWISMGDEAEQGARLAAFRGFTVDDALMDRAKDEAVFLHCLPGHWGEEATYEVAHGPRSLIGDEAEARMWVQMAVLCHLVE